MTTLCGVHFGLDAEGGTPDPPEPQEPRPVPARAARTPRPT